MSEAEDLFSFQLRAAKVQGFEREVKFSSTRRWRFDFARWPIAVEVEGGSWMAKSRHTSGKGFEKDAEKYNEAAILGWRVLRVTPAQVKSGQALRWLEALIKEV